MPFSTNWQTVHFFPCDLHKIHSKFHFIPDGLVLLYNTVRLISNLGHKCFFNLYFRITVYVNKTFLFS
jgi:hypothetical protein